MTGIFKKQNEVESSETEKPLFRTAVSGFNKNDVNLYINSLNKKINSLEEQLSKANEKLQEKQYSSNAALETQILELREELRREKAKGGSPAENVGMPEAVSARPDSLGDLSDEFKDIMI